MIKRVHVLNGTESHDFKVGERYINFGTDQVVVDIKLITDGKRDGYRVIFEDKSFVDVITENILVFCS
jgi:3-deoxy-D-manno-octulosonic acid (KDO) 8-phosphate synthase